VNHAGLDHLQISIDNIMPDDVSKKSLKVLEKKLGWLAEHAEFDVNINSVLGSSVVNPEDAVVIARRAIELGFQSTVGLIHDGSGQMRRLSEMQRAVYETISKFTKPFHTAALYERFYKNLVRGLPNQWQCRAGSRYLYICEDGKVHYCSQQRGYPGIPLEDYKREHLEREYHSVKPCAAYCTIPCVQRVAMVDEFRESPRGALIRFFPPKKPELPLSGLPPGIKILAWMFLPSGSAGSSARTGILRKAAQRVLVPK
jgi:MoaA/NifB/PqqE/SkfB family radical SAM enzyme